MSHYQNKGDRSEGQLKKTGRSSGPGHQRSGVPPSSVKGGGAGGPSPSGSAPPAPAASLGGVQPPAGAPPARPTTPASSTNRGGKRANGPAGASRSTSSAAPVDYGGSYKGPQYAGPPYPNQPPQPPQQAVVRQGLGPTDVNQHPATNAGQQSEIRQITPRASLPGTGGAPPSIPRQHVVGSNMAPGAAARPSPPSVSAATVVGSDPVSPVATSASSAVDMSRVTLQSSFSFQFGSITPGFPLTGMQGMQIPARTSSAPPNLDEQKRDQARFELNRGNAANKVPTVPTGPPPGVARGVSSANEPPAILQQSLSTQGAPVGGTSGVQSQQQQASQPPGMAQQPVQYTQGQGHPVSHQGHQISQAASQQLHIQMAAQVQVQAHAQAQAQAQAHQAQAQAQAQAQQQQQVLAQQTLPQQSLPQQGMVQQSLSQGMKYPQSMMAPPHGAQMISQQMGNPMAGQLSGQQVPPQMAHQLGPQMGGAMGQQLPPGITGAQYGPPATNQFIQPQRSRAVKIVHPETHEELRFDAKTKKGDSFIDLGPPTSGSVSAGLPVRVTSNGPPQTRAPVNYGSGPHHTMVSNMYNFPMPSGYAGPPYGFQSVPPPKSAVSAAGPPTNTPAVRYSYGVPTPPTYHPGAAPTPPGTRVVPPAGLGITVTTSEISTATPPASLVASPVGGPPPPPPTATATLTSAPVVSARAVPPQAQLGGNPAPSSNGRATGLVSGPAVGNIPVPVTPIAIGSLGFKFGDVDESGSTITVPGAESSSENVSSAPVQASSTNGSTPTGEDISSTTPSVPGSEGSSWRKDSGSRNSTPATTSKPTVSLPSSKTGSVPSGSNLSSPKVASGPSTTPSGEKTKTENPKPAITRENSRKLSKKEKAQRNQQQQQQQVLPYTAPIVDSDGERKGDAPINASATAGQAAGASEKVTAASPKVALQRSYSGVQSNPGTAGKTSSTGKFEDAKLTSKLAADPEKRASGKLSVLPTPNPEANTSVQVLVSSEGDDSSRKLTPKQGSGKSLTSSKSLEGKDPLNADASTTGKNSSASKLSSSFSKALSVTSAVKEVLAGHGGELSPRKGPGGKASQSNEAIKEAAALDSLGSSSSTPELPASQQDEDTAVGASSQAVTEVSIVTLTKLPEVVNGEEDLTGDAWNSCTEGLKDVKSPVDRTQGSQSTSIDKEGGKKSHVNGTSVVEGKAALPSDGPSDLTTSSAKDISTTSADDTVVDGTRDEPVAALSEKVVKEKDSLTETKPTADIAKTDAPSNSHLHSVASEIESVLGNEKISLVEAIAKEKEAVEHNTDVIVSNPTNSTPGHESIRSKAVASVGTSESSASVEPRRPKYKPDITVNVDNLVEPSDSFLPNHPSGDHGGVSSVEKAQDGHRNSDNSGFVEDYVPRDGSEIQNASVASSSAELESSSSAAPELKPSGSKKKKKKEIYAKADAQGPTADLFTAYKAPEEKKLDDQVKRSEVLGSSNPGGDLKKDSSSSFEKPTVLKELDDWEDAAELPTPKITSGVASISSDVNVASAETPNPGHFGIKKYTRDFLITQQNLNRDLPPEFEIRVDLSELFLNRDSHPSGDALPSPGRYDRQSSGAGARLDRRNSNVGAEEDRWTRQPGSVSSPGRVPPDGPMGMAGPPGGFRPGGQSRNAGLMGMPPVGMRTGMVPQGGIMPMGSGGLLPNNPLLAQQHMMMQQNSGPGRPMNPAGGGVDADRWQRAPVAQKGLIPSPRTPLPAIHKTENRYQVGKVSDEEQGKQRLIKGILNKLTPQNFDKLFAQVKEVHIDSATTLTGVISQIFDKALTEPTFCEMYAKFCVQLAVELPEFTEDEEKITFKRVLLNKCQEEFERGEREQQEAEKVEEEGEVKLTAEEREEMRTKARRRMLGNIRFIGELYKKNMLTERIMHECIKKLLGEYQNPDEEDVEALCKLMSTIGRIIDHQKAKEHIDAYFKRMEKLTENTKLSSRLKFMLKDVIDLRRNGWQERRKVEGPKKIDELHRDAVQERQAAAASGRDRLQQRGGMAAGGGRRPGNDFAMRGPQPQMYSQGSQMVGNMPMSGIRGAQPQPMRGGFGQDVRTEDRLLMDRPPVPMPLSQRPSDEGIKLGPQGGLGRGMGSRGAPLVSGRSALADVPQMPFGEGRRPGMGHMSGFGTGMISDRGPYGGRDDNMLMRGAGFDRPLGGADRPLLEMPLGQERLAPTSSGRDMRASDRPLERPRTPYGASSSMRPMTPPTPVRHAPAATLALSEDELKKKSLSTIVEYYSVRDIKEAAVCVDELKTPKFHPTMVSMWVSDALEKKDVERELLMKLIVHLRNTDPALLTPEHIFRGFEQVLTSLEDLAVDVPRAPEYVAGMFSKLIVTGIFSLPQVGKLLKDCISEAGGGSLLQSGHAFLMFGSVLDTFRREKGEEDMIAMYRNSGLHLEDFLSPEHKRRGGYFESFLEKKNLQCLYPMIPVENYLRDAMDRDEPVADILKWLEKNVPQSTWTEASFLRLIMRQVLRRSVPVENNKIAPQFEITLEGKVKKYASLLKRFANERAKTAEANQRQYIVALQLFADDLGHPPGLVTALFSDLYREEVISERAFLQWQDDVNDSTPGRAKAIKDTFKWFRWLEEAPEDGGDEED